MPPLPRVDAATTARLRAALTDEVAKIVAKPDARITPADIMRLGRIDALTDARRPALPPQHLFRLHELPVHGWLPTGDNPSAHEIDLVRRWIFGQSDTALDLVADRLGRGEPIETSVLGAIYARGPHALERAGLDRPRLLAAALQSLQGAGARKARVIEGDLELVATLTRELDLPDPAAHRVRAELLSLLDENLARVRLTTRDGAAGFPDYGAIGRAAAHGELLLRMSGGHGRAPAPVADAAQVVW